MIISNPAAADATVVSPHFERPIRWVFAGLLLLASVVNYIDRQALSVLTVTIQRDLHISDVQYGTVVQCFLAAYMVMYVVSGRLVDRFGARWTQTVFLVTWSVADACTGLATGTASLALSRAALGAAEPGNFTASLRAVGDWFSARERSVAVGIYSMGGTLGAAIAVPLAAGLALRFGWRSTFLATGAFGILIAVFWAVIYQEPPGRLTSAKRVPWLVVLRQPHVVPLLLTRMMTDSVWYFFLFWCMKYLQESHRLPLATVGRTLWVLYVAADVGSLLGGWASSRFVNRVPVAAARLIVMVPAGACMLGLATVPWMHQFGIVVGILSLLALCHMVWMTNITTLALDLFPKELATTVQGLVGAASALGGLITAGIIARTIQTHGYTPIFLAMSVMHPIAAVILYLTLRPRLRPHARADTTTLQGMLTP